MALELTYASDATLLLDDLVDSLGRPGSAAGVVVPVLMPSLPLVDRTKAALARRHGVAMGVAFLLPGSFIEHMAQLVGLDPVRLEFPILSLNPGLRQRCVAPDVWGRRIAGGGTAAIVEEAGRHAGRLTGGAPRRAPAADGDAVAVEDPRAIGITARQRRDQPPIGCESGAHQPLIGR